MDRKNKGFSARKPNSGSVQSFHPNKSKLVSNNSSFHVPKSSKGRAEDIFSEKKRVNESSDALKYKNNKKKNNKSQIFSEKSFDESSSSLMSFREDDHDPPMKFRSGKNKVETGKILPQSKKIKKQIPKTPSTEDDQPQDVSPKKRKTQWTSDADAQVIKLLAELGPKWTEIGKIMGGRSGKQVRDRYLQKLRPDISFEKWTEEEDALVIALYKKYGHKWSQIAAEVKTRSESQIKNRFNTRLKRLINNKKPQKNSHRKMEEEADQEQEEEEDQEQEEQQQDDEEEEEEDLGAPLSPLVRAESLAKLEDDKQAHHNVALVDFEEIFLKKSMRLPSFQKLTSVSIKKQNSAIAQEFRGQGVNYSSLFNSGSQPHHILPDFHHNRSKHDF